MPWNWSASDRPTVVVTPTDMHGASFQPRLIGVVAVGALAVEGTIPEHLLCLPSWVTVGVVAHRGDRYVASGLAPAAQRFTFQLCLAGALPSRGSVQMGEGTTT